MKTDTPKPTLAEKKFDRAKEEAFSNEGAPPPACGPADKTKEGTVATDAPSKDAAGARPDKGSVVGGVCSLLSNRLPGRGC